jgi:hypothetical protein
MKNFRAKPENHYENETENLLYTKIMAQVFRDEDSVYLEGL